MIELHSEQKKLESKKNEIGLILFYIIYVFMFYNSFINETVLKNYIFNEITLVLSITSLIILLIKVLFFDRFTYIELLLYIIIGCILLIVVYKSREYLLINLFITMVAANKVSDIKIIKISFITLTINLFLVIFSSIVGIIPNLIYTRISISGEQVFRNSFGTTFPTILGSFILFWSLQYLYLRKNINYKDSLFFLLLAYLINKYTDNRLVVSLLLLLMVYTIIYFVTKINFTKLSFKIQFFWITTINILIFGYIYICFNYNSNIEAFRFLDRLLSGRIYLSWQGFIKYPITLFGNIVEMNGWGNGNQLSYGVSYFYLDSLPINLLITSGLFTFSLYLLYNLTFINKCFKDKNERLLIIITIILLYDLVDNKSIRVSFNPFILIYFNMIFQRKKYDLTKREKDEAN